MTMTLTFLNILLGLLLLAVPCYLFYTFDRLTLPKALVSLLRGTGQLAVMGAVLWLLYRYDSVWLCLLWLAVLAVAASFLLVSRCRLSGRVMLAPACVAMFASVLAVSLYMLLVVLRPLSSLSARWFVPLTAVLMAHVLTTNIPAVRTYFDSLRQDSQPYLTLLGNGASRLQALSPYVGKALRSLAVPMMSSLSVMGLFVLPMLLSGLLLGGMGPARAVVVFLLLMVAAVATSMLSLVLLLWLADRRAFNRHGQLR